MAKTSVHFQEVKKTSEEHNYRKKILDYVKPELKHLNESFEISPISKRLEEKKKKYQETTRQKMQEKANPIREGVIVIEDKTTMSQLKDFANKCKNRFGIEAIQIHIHRDEGHLNELGEWKTNQHAHIIFDWTAENGKSIKLNRFDMSEIQTILAESLGMERGESSEKVHLNALQYKIKMQLELQAKLQASIEHLKELEKDVSDKVGKLFKKEQDLREELKETRELVKQGEEAKAILKRFDELKPILGTLDRNIFGNIKIEPIIAKFERFKEESQIEIDKLKAKLEKTQEENNRMGTQVREAINSKSIALDKLRRLEMEQREKKNNQGLTR